MDKVFPMHLWDRLLHQAVITLNMLQTSRINPKLSASTHIDGQYDYNRAPMAPPGTRIIAHETPNIRRTWAPHGQDGWYIGLALEQYRCYTVYITKKISERVVETVEFFSTEVPLIYIIKGIGNSGIQTIDSCTTQPATGRTIMSGMRRTNARYRATSSNLRECATDTQIGGDSPLVEIDDNDTPSRVQIEISPPGVVNEATPLRMMQPTVTHITTPNSYGGLSSIPFISVAPTPSYYMIRRSAHQQNLSNDMLAQTVQ
jgi:hypothetical protein